MRTRSRELMTARRNLARTLEALAHCRADGAELVDYVPHFLAELERQARRLSDLTLTAADRRHLEDDRGGRLYALDCSRARIRYDRVIDAKRQTVYCAQCGNPRQGDTFGELCGICAKAKHSTHAHPGNCVCEVCKPTRSTSSPSSSGTDVPAAAFVPAGFSAECHKCGQLIRIIPGDRLAPHAVGLGPCPGSNETVYRSGGPEEIYTPEGSPFAELTESPYTTRTRAPQGTGPKRLPRARCPLCERSVALRNHGELREHGSGSGICPGSGYTPERAAELEALAIDQIGTVHPFPAEVRAAVDVPEVIERFIKSSDASGRDFGSPGVAGWVGEPLPLGPGFYLPGELEAPEEGGGVPPDGS